MITILSAFVSLLSFRVRSRASLKLELVALRHQVTVLRRQRPGRARLLCADRLLWVWLYQVWPQVLNAMVLVKPATVIQWHRKGFRLYWRWRSRHLGRPKMNSEIRELIRQMSVANPLWGAPRIHGELLKLISGHFPIVRHLDHCLIGCRCRALEIVRATDFGAAASLRISSFFGQPGNVMFCAFQ